MDNNLNEMSMLKYKALYDWVVESINANKLKYGGKLPSENMLCKKFSISRQTVRNAFDKLAADGIVYRVKGSGTFVNIHAKNQKSNTIGVCLSYMNDYLFSNILKGANEVLTNAGYGIDLGFSHNRIVNEAKFLERMINSNVAGLIMEGVKTGLPNPNLELYKKLEEDGVPVIFIHNYYKELSFQSVLMSDEKCAYLMTKMLIEAGHKKIAGFFKYDDLQGHWRYLGYIRALIDAGLNVKEERIRMFDSSASQTKIIIESFIDKLKECTALVCYNDLSLIEFFDKFNKEGISVPDDLSVVSFDDTIVQTNGVGITSAAHPKEELGKIAASQLIKMIDGGQEKPKERFIYIEPKINVRDSIKKL